MYGDNGVRAHKCWSKAGAAVSTFSSLVSVRTAGRLALPGICSGLLLQWFSFGSWWCWGNPLECPSTSEPSRKQSCHCQDCTAVPYWGGEKPFLLSSAFPSQFQQLHSDSCFFSLLSNTDFLMLNDSLYVQATYIAGKEVWRQDVSGM